MYVSMNPKGETGKVIHISQNDTNREVEFIPYDQNGLTPLTDGQLMARINSIKGNTVSFNQLAHGNFTNTYEWVTATCTFSVSNNQGTMKATAQYGGIIQNIDTIVGHKYFICVDVLSSSQSVNIRSVNGGINVNSSKTSWEHFAFIITATNTTTDLRLRDGASSNWIDQYFKNAMCHDLTLMGIDNLTTTAEVEQWLSTHIGDLPYFGYTQGTLIPFNGSGLKTVGKNLWDNSLLQNGYFINANFDFYSDSKYASIYVDAFANVTYTFSFGVATRIIRTLVDGGYNQNTVADITSFQVTPTKDGKIGYSFRREDNTNWDNTTNIQIEFGSTATAYEPYTSNTLSLPTSTYFPFGEDGVGTVYDELIPNTDVYKRMGIVDLGNLTYFIESDYFVAVIPNIKQNPYTSTTLKCARYITSPTSLANLPDKSIRYYGNSNKIIIKDSSYNTTSALQSSLQGTYLVYELATPLHNYGVVDLGSLNWKASASANNYEMYSDEIVGAKPASSNSSIANIVCSKYKTSSRSGGSGTYNEVTGIAIGTNGYVYVYDPNYNTSSSTSAFKTAMSGVYLLYELETPVAPSLDLTYPVWNGGTEQILPVNDSTPDTAPIKANITYPDRTEDTEFLYKQTSFEWIYKSWAFVCKNITQALSVVGNALKGTIPGTMTSESGKFPLKVKMTDNDGVCFSEKIDLYVERKP